MSFAGSITSKLSLLLGLGLWMFRFGFSQPLAADMYLGRFVPADAA